MNQKWPVLLLALLLCGCRNQQPPLEIQGVSGPAIAVTEPTDSVGSYASDSPVEEATGGAVKAFLLEVEDVLGFRFLGEDILLFSGHDATTLTLLFGETRYIRAQVTLACSVLPDDPSVVVDSKGVSYLDSRTRELVFLNSDLIETHRTLLPEFCGTPILAADRKWLYYSTETALRVLEIETGMDRLLRTMEFPIQELISLQCDDTVLQCSVVYKDGNARSLFLATDTGALLCETAADLPLWTAGEFFIARHMDGTYAEWLTGTNHSEPKVLVWESEPASIKPVPEIRSLLTYTPKDDAALLECYQLESGKKIAQITMPSMHEPTDIQWEADTYTLWLLSTDPVTGQEQLYAWNLEASPTEDVHTYLQTRWTRTNPDLDGLAQCNLLARSIGVKHGVDILLWMDATAYEPWDYSLTAEYQVPLLRRRLEELDALLSCFPDGFLDRAASGTSSGRLSICLVRSINGKAGTGALDSAMGLQFWNHEARAYLAITAESGIAQHLYHELFHIIDSYILSSCNAFDNWGKLNPKGFSYDTQYISGRSHEGHSFLNADKRYFMDLYAMTSPREDRARIMEYAMLDGQVDLFRSAPMQAKLQTLCQGIRKAFGLDDYNVIYRWEQYLDAPLTP